ncbi:MAG TPA: DNA polymerase III subunit gamma/tau [Verrucomicrobiae bacterium]|nr:DNA polymerase III subunit gamma/tau [Verrucomicrobiae bacterium]
MSSYQVIARKYRPQRFADVVGQEHVSQTLAHAIEQNRIAHAYLFCGPRGTGKTTLARIFAKALNCTGGPRADFDVNDPKCVEIAEGRSMDVLEIDGASNNGVEQVRELRDTCKYAPASSKFKIYIIDEVHMLSTAAFNALLKTLEEPPAHVKFMFATTDPEKVLPTILSRCQRFDLRRIPASLIVQQLSKIAKEEKVQITPAALHAIARGADGGMRDAESTLDQLISFCGDSIEEADVLSMFGLTAQGQLIELSCAMLNGEVENSLRLLNNLAKGGKDLGRLLSDLLNHFRNLLIFQVSKGDLNLLEVSESEAGALQEQSALASAEALTRIMEVLTDTEGRLRDASSKKILLEVALLKAIQARNALSIDSVLERLQELRGGPPAGSPPPPLAPSASAPPVPARAQTAAPAAKPVRTEVVSIPAAAAAERPSSAALEAPSANTAPSAEDDLELLWAKLLELAGRASPFTRTYLLEAHPVSFVKGLFTIGFPSACEDHIALVDNTKTQALLKGKLAELGHPNCHVRFVKAEPSPERQPVIVAMPSPAPASASPSPSPANAAKPPPRAASPSTPAKDAPAPPVFSKEDFKNDPLIQKALEIFKGQIVDIRPASS